MSRPEPNEQWTVEQWQASGRFERCLTVAEVEQWAKVSRWEYTLVNFYQCQSCRRIIRVRVRRASGFWNHHQLCDGPPQPLATRQHHK